MIDLKNMDCLEAMKQMDDNQFDLAIVDPPYGIDVANDSRFGQKGNKAAGRVFEKAFQVVGTISTHGSHIIEHDGWTVPVVYFLHLINQLPAFFLIHCPLLRVEQLIVLRVLIARTIPFLYL